jgi:hypothetical protein
MVAVHGTRWFVISVNSPEAWHEIGCVHSFTGLSADVAPTQKHQAIWVYVVSCIPIVHIYVYIVHTIAEYKNGLDEDHKKDC